MQLPVLSLLKAQVKQKNMCVSGYPTVPKFWLPTLKFLEQQKYSFNLSERFFVFQSSNHCYTALVHSRVSSEYIQQIQLSTISQKKCKSNKMQQNRNKNGECYTMLWDNHVSPKKISKCNLLPEREKNITSIPGKFPMGIIFSMEHHQTVPATVDVDSPVTTSNLNKQFDLKSLRFSCITNSTKEGDDLRGNKENNWCISSPHDRRRQSFYNVSAVIYKTKDFVMFVAVNNDVHNIPVLVNKETVVKLRNSFELCMNTERLLKIRKHGGTLFVSSTIDHVTGSRNDISSRYRFDVCWQIKVTSSKCKYTATRENWNYSVQFSKNWTWWSIIIIDAFKHSNTGSIFLYKILNFDKIPSCSAGIKDGFSRKDKLYNCLTEEFQQRLLDFPRGDG